MYYRRSNMSTDREMKGRGNKRVRVTREYKARQKEAPVLALCTNFAD
jgi:hypothetical protein